jgi:hypothetical protein
MAVFTLMYISNLYCKPKQNLRKRTGKSHWPFFMYLFIYSFIYLLNGLFIIYLFFICNLFNGGGSNSVHIYFVYIFSRVWVTIDGVWIGN